MEHLEDPSEAVRRASALALGEVGVSAAHDEGQILQALHNSDVSTRVAASLALLSLDTVSFSTDLVSGLKDSDAQVRQGVAAVLGETGDVRSLPSLVGLLKNDADAGVRAEAAFRLGKVGYRCSGCVVSGWPEGLESDGFENGRIGLVGRLGHRPTPVQ